MTTPLANQSKGGLKFLVNDTGGDVYVKDLEASIGYHLSQGSWVWVDKWFPWCSDSNEIVTKAFKVFKGTSEQGELLYYMFADWPANTNVWCGPSGEWNTRKSLWPNGDANVVLSHDGKPYAGKY